MAKQSGPETEAPKADNRKKQSGDRSQSQTGKRPVSTNPASSGRRTKGKK
jgi:hypothetical protein